ncbi:MAG: UDP-N-acetylmuramate:L-alanyl-gamma-D-glutamyl-meso-diaminopimelate ligase [Candidatus Binatia bacterium]|jgi:UDP-N-acetylmuramate: L-alanyl-gamma-D-glutamyl-meso-diaminopimelate ligase|nr:UDP-N-acetylmuramate:L-alanyl-gamma-D-glutamyl-meso-diaminopimelate ligase [Candidatus Binatia bacterium]
MIDLPPRGGHVHLIAICGVGMASLAGLLQAMDYRVTGSDQDIYPPMSTYLAGLGIEVSSGFREAFLEDRPDLVVIGNAVTRGNPEAQAVLGTGIPYLSFPQALGRFLIDAKRSIVVAGTHGKTTTTSLMAWVLSQGGIDPSFFVGGIPVNFDGGVRQGSGPWVLLEGDEYDSAFFDKGPKFLHYRPEKVVLTSVEFDHADIYRDLDHLKSAFGKLVDLIPYHGTLLVCNRFPEAVEVARSARCPVVFYGEGEPGSWSVKSVQSEGQRTRFEPCYKGKREGTVEISLTGRHNVENALAVYVTARELGVEPQVIREGMGTFAGIRRRQEVLGEVGGVLVIDDFAHHPTAVGETIAGIRAAYPERRLWAVFEPRSHTSRRRIFEREFSRVLAGAHHVVVAGLYQPEKIPEAERLSPVAVVKEICRLGGDERAVYLERADDIASHVGERATSGDIILVMSNGAFGKVRGKILHILEAKNKN